MWRLIAWVRRGQYGFTVARGRDKRQKIRAASFKNHDSPALGRCSGQASDISIQAKEILRVRDILNGILAEHTGKSIKAVSKDTDRDYFMSPEDARDYGLIDNVMEGKKSADKAG